MTSTAAPAPSLHLGGIRDASLGLRPAAAQLRVLQPYGTAGKSRVIDVELSREDLVRLVIAAGGALAALDDVNVR